MNAGQDGFRDESSKQMSDLIEGHRGMRYFSHRGSIDHTICSSCKFWHRLSTVAVELASQRTLPLLPICLGNGSTASMPAAHQGSSCWTYGEQEDSAYNGHFGRTCYHPLFVFNQLFVFN